MPEAAWIDGVSAISPGVHSKYVNHSLTENLLCIFCALFCSAHSSVVFAEVAIPIPHVGTGCLPGGWTNV